MFYEEGKRVKYIQRVISGTTGNIKYFVSALGIFALLVLLIFPPPADAADGNSTAHGQVIRVGPQRTIKTLAEASKIAVNGDTVEVDAGEYYRDVAIWTQSELTLKAINGRVRLLAGGASAEGKAIWVIRGGRIQIQGFDFLDASVGDHNG